MSQRYKNWLPQQRRQIPLVGRDALVEEALLKLLLERRQLLTLHGPPGVGKTRLALEIATRFIDVSPDTNPPFPDGVFYVNLDPISEEASELVLPRIAERLDSKTHRRQVHLQVLIDSLADKQLLLILDDCDRVKGATAKVLGELLNDPRTRRVQVLVTSRELLDVFGENNLHVPPFELPAPESLGSLEDIAQNPAVALFMERAEAKGGFKLSDGNAGKVVEICRYLDGLPLAIILVAPYSVPWSTSTLLGEWKERLDTLRIEGGDQVGHQQTLRAAIKWTHDLLGSPEKKLFQQLSVFEGGSTIEAIKAVCGSPGSEDTHELHGTSNPIGLLIKSLWEKSWIYKMDEPDHVEGSLRYAMLQTLHRYAEECLRESGEEEAVRKRHADYFVAEAEKADKKLGEGPNQEITLAWFDKEYPNLRAALKVNDAELKLRLVGALGRFWDRHGYMREGRKLTEEALTQRQYASPEVRATALLWGGAFASDDGDDARAVELLDESLDLYVRADNKLGIARVFNILGNVALRQHSYDQAEDYCTRSLHLYVELNDKQGIALLQGNLGEVYRSQGKIGDAEQHLTKSLVLFKELEDNDGTAVTLTNLGQLELGRGNARLAERLLKEALVLAQELGLIQTMAWCLLGLAGVARAEGLLPRAALLAGAVEKLLEATGMRLEPLEAQLRVDIEAACRTHLGEKGWFAAMEKGRAMSRNQAIESALTPEEGTPVPRSAEHTLRPRQLEVLCWAAQGESNADVGKLLSIEKVTVDRHLYNVYGKLGLRSDAQNKRGANPRVSAILRANAEGWCLAHQVVHTFVKSVRNRNVDEAWSLLAQETAFIIKRPELETAIRHNNYREIVAAFRRVPLNNRPNNEFRISITDSTGECMVRFIVEEEASGWKMANVREVRGPER
ncbi:MAG: tetratricopeptide repeat protein [Chloroflexota bacterium]|nr:tetratricopeptide repeat protein [Chloroflexota bacterium]